MTSAQLRFIHASLFAALVAAGSSSATANDELDVLWQIGGHAERIRAFDVRGSLIASSSEDRTAKLWHVANARLLHTYVSSSSVRDVRSVALSPDETLVASGTFREFSLWRADDGSNVFTIPGFPDYVTLLAFSPDGTMIGVVGRSSSVELRRVTDGSVIRETLPGASIHTFVFSPDGTLIATGLDNGDIQLFRVSDGALLATLELHVNHVGALAFSFDGSLLASGSFDQTIGLWSIPEGIPVNVLPGHRDEVLSVAFLPGDDVLVSGGGKRDRTIRLWSVPDGTPEGVFRVNDDGARVRVSPDGSLVTLRTDRLELRRASDGQIFHTVTTFRGRLYNVVVSPNGTMLAAASEDNVVHIVRVADGRILRTVGHGIWGHVYDVDFSPDNALLTTAHRDRQVRVWRVADGQLLHGLEGHGDAVRTVDFSPDGLNVASGGYDETIRIWRVSDGELVRTIVDDFGFLSLRYSPDGELIATSSLQEDLVKVWRVSDGKIVHVLGGHTAYIKRLAFAPNSSVLATASDDGTIRLWDVTNGSHIRTLEGHDSGVTEVAFSRGGEFLASGDKNGTTRVWRVSDGENLKTYPAIFNLSPLGLAFAPVGGMLVNAREDGALIVARDPFGEDPIPCDAVQFLKSSCRRGKLKIKLQLTGDEHNGRRITLDVNSEAVEARIRGSRAKKKLCNRTGEQNIALLDPPGCDVSETARCR